MADKETAPASTKAPAKAPAKASTRAAGKKGPDNQTATHGQGQVNPGQGRNK